MYLMTSGAEGEAALLFEMAAAHSWGVRGRVSADTRRNALQVETIGRLWTCLEQSSTLDHSVVGGLVQGYLAHKKLPPP